MPGTKVKELYLAKSVKDLQKIAIIPNTKPNQLVKSAQTLFVKAGEEQENGDEEKAYVLYTKYFEIARYIKASKEYIKDKVYYDSMISPKQLKAAMGHLEALDKSLEARYQSKIDESEKLRKNLEMMKIANKEVKFKNQENGHAHVNNNNNANTVMINSEHEGHFMEPRQLYALINEKSSTFLILDARPTMDYKASHLKHNSLNVPEEILKAGITVQKIERGLHIEDRNQWPRRLKVDKLILMDWQSEDFTEGTPLFHLKKAMFHFDTFGGTTYKSQALILRGGFDHLAMSYPTIVTNPQKSRPPTANSNLNKKETINIDSLEYPDLDQGFIGTPSPYASPLTSGAITLSDPDNMEVKSSPSRSKPKIPDRTTKPGLEPPANKGLDDTNTSIRSSVSSVLNKAMISDEDLEVSPVIPKIDRSTKGKVLQKLEKASEILEAENEIVEESLKLENKQLAMEKEWEVLRLKRESAANEEMKNQVVEREEQLLEQLNQISKQKEAKEIENEELLKQLEAMKIRLENTESDRRKQEDIQRKKREQNARKQEIAILRAQRLQKQKDRDLEHALALQDQRRRNEEARRKREETEQRLLTPKAKIPLKTMDGPSSGGSNLNRSHSSPNIAKMLEEEEIEANLIPTPKFDRSSKPSVEFKSRNFQGTWGTAKKGLTGLRNLGNTCYMNSLLQCLSNFTIPSQYFIGEKFREHLNRSSDTRGEIAVEFAEVIRMLWSGQYKSIAPTDFKYCIGKFNEMFRGKDQQDAHELLLILMEYLHQDVNLVRRKVKLPEQKNDNIPEIEAAKKAWEMEKLADQSFIRETFYGQQRSTLTCPHCGWSSVTYESFFELPLKLPNGNKRCSVAQLIESYLSGEQVPYKCPTCKKERQCSKQFEIVKLPLILTVSLGRFYNDGLSSKKQNFVDFELSDVNFGQYAKACNGQLNRYKDYTLYGVSNHSGSLECGHYTAYCFSQVYRKWYKYDDTEVSELDSPSDVKSPKAYILFYSAKN